MRRCKALLSRIGPARSAATSGARSPALFCRAETVNWLDGGGGAGIRDEIGYQEQRQGRTVNGSAIGLAGVVSRAASAWDGIAGSSTAPWLGSAASAG